MDPVARIIDANANRAGEALRTLEDLARFALDDAATAEALKSLRHALSDALRALPRGWIEASRDVAGDVGTNIGTDAEARRTNLADVAVAAGKRAAEALRVLEETTKIIDSTIAASLERARYRTYDLATDIARRVPAARREQWRVCVLLSEELCVRPWRDVARAALDGGADAIQLREKAIDGGELVRRAAWLVEQARPLGARVIVNDRADVAIAANADGVHVGQTDLAPQQVRQMCGARLVVGTSTHSIDEMTRGDADGVDYCGIGAMFASSAKPNVAPRGPELLATYLERFAAIPHLAIGGITPANVDALVDVGCLGVAVSTCVCAAAAPDRVVATLRRAFERAPSGAAR